MDTGCTSHVTNVKSDFNSYKKFTHPGKAHLAGEDISISILGMGTVQLEHDLPTGEHRQITLNNVLYIPQALSQFFAPRIPVLAGYCIVIENDTMTVMDKEIKDARIFFDCQIPTVR